MKKKNKNKIEPESPQAMAQLDAILSEHFRGALAGQSGRALAAFRSEIQHTRRRRIGWSAFMAVAAGMMIAWGVMAALTRPNNKPGQPAHPMEVAKAPETPKTAPMMVQSASWSRMMDDGMTMVNNQPARQLRRTILQEVEYYDPATKATVRMMIPREQIILIGVKAD